jgi:predicted ATP-binding protein involved in virulence
MKLNNIQIQNFRCFNETKISFGRKTTVLFGKNGTGKTTIINAMKSAMSFIFSKYKTKNEKLTLLGNSADLHLINLSKMDAFLDEENISQYPISIACNAEFNQNQIDWAIVKNTVKGKLLATNYRDAFLTFTRHYNSDIKMANLPVLAFFSDSYPHKKINIGSYAKSVLKSGNFSRPFGYYQWDAEANCSEIWQNRYLAQYSKILDFKNTKEDTIRERKEIEFIDNKIKTFTEPLREDLNFINKEFEVTKISFERPFKDEVFIKFIFSDGRQILFENLPQGYNRLLSIVFDIAYRSYILNGEKEPEGIVFIDEIELHLHPTLQQEVLDRFRKTFPEIQFIVSTHSPLVLSNLMADGEQNKIIKLKNDGVTYTHETIDNLYGTDYITSLMEIMDATYRPSTIDKLIDLYVTLKARNKNQDAKSVYDKLKDVFNGEPNQFIKDEIKNKLKSYQ